MARQGLQNDGGGRSDPNLLNIGWDYEFLEDSKEAMSVLPVIGTAAEPSLSPDRMV